MNQEIPLMDKIVSLAKRRGFVFPGSEIYGGMANSWDYGPLGVELKNNIKQLWWSRFVHRRDDIVGIDTALIMNPKVWEASGHLANFSDPLIECKMCHGRFRVDLLLDQAMVDGKSNKTMEMLKNWSVDEVTEFLNKNIGPCPQCKAVGKFTPPRQFNLMFKTFIGPAEEQANIAYFRPETAQGMFVNFKNVLDTTRKKLPFGIAQIGKAFRNEITPGNFIFRTREFEQMEVEFFTHPADAEKWFEYWLNEQKTWVKEIGIEEGAVFIEIPEADRAHYSKRSVDTEYQFPFGQKELYGIAYRTDFDLKNHMKASGQSLEYTDPQTGEKLVPHVIEPTWGVDRTMLAVLCASYHEDGEGDEKRVYLKLPPKLAPYKAAVFPLIKNKPELVTKAKEIYDNLRAIFPVAWDDRGNIGKRYYAQDEIGTPYCITVDFQSLDDKTVTIRDRDTAKQERVKIEEVINYLRSKI